MTKIKWLMELKCIKESAYQRLSEGRDQVLTKDRGYGVIYIPIDDMIFALPLRSNLNHPHGFKTVLNGKFWNGIDYSKALVVKSEDLECESFKTRSSAEYRKIKTNKEKIKREFFQYLQDYITAVNNGNADQRRFKFTTLQYFHKELGIE